MTRYKILDELLSNQYHNYSLDDLTEEVSSRLADMYPDTNGVGRRQIEKDIHYLEYEGPFLAEIDRYTITGYDMEKQKAFTKKCLRYSDPSYSIFKKELSDDEEYLLKEVLSMLGQFEGLPNLKALEGLRLSLGLKHDGREIISLTRNPLEKSNFIGELFTAISHRLVVELHYHTFSNPQTGLSAIVHPYLLKEYNHRWFLFAAADSDQKFLCFAIDRLDKVIPLPYYKYMDYKGDINEQFEDIVGVTINETSPVYQICFWVSDASKDYVATKPIHESQRNIKGTTELELREQYPMLQNGSIFRIDCKENYELIRELSSFGKELVVLSPKSIREKIERRIDEMGNIYKITGVGM